MGIRSGEMRVLKVAAFVSLAKEVLIISVAHCKPVRIDSRHCEDEERGRSNLLRLLRYARNDVQLISTEQLYL